MRYEFTVVDVTCEKCEARILDAVQGLPGATGIQVVRTPEDEALVSFASEEPIARTPSSRRSRASRRAPSTTTACWATGATG